ncbi:LysR substrate-binding domain-containing protein [Polaromonas sp. JS666]|uniref:LysR substrate-binding domain-containing protein n=1 Tax=Polaromonas sp. (strain JS666 / ATCC BAA-500) TaxID=296591 RepID=UPI00088F8A06|nr:LysR substrate-binding domain-containing protein [Polaromonas sp. JS666]SDN89622.1 DNA-binding transcriptional regulator, LysR family [Polaromonas sp. JS666]
MLNPSSSHALRAMSLDAIRGFESAARHLSFTAAAEELCITQSAVSKQVKSLEDALGAPLFLRGGKGLSLTPQGRELYEAARASLSQLASAVDRLLAVDRASVAVTTTPSFAALWLAPKLAKFQQLEPAIDVRVDASEARVNLEREGLDLAVRLYPVQPGDESLPLLQEQALLVAAPAVAARIHSPADIAHIPLLVYYDPATRFPWMSWPDWYERLGLKQSAQQPCLYFSQYEHVVNAAVQGGGIAIGRTPLVLPLLRGGQLTVVLPGQTVDGLGYRIITSAHSADRPAVQKFRAWLERELALEAIG